MCGFAVIVLFALVMQVAAAADDEALKLSSAGTDLDETTLAQAAQISSSQWQVRGALRRPYLPLEPQLGARHMFAPRDPLLEQPLRDGTGTRAVAGTPSGRTRGKVTVVGPASGRIYSLLRGDRDRNSRPVRRPPPPPSPPQSRDALHVFADGSAIPWVLISPDVTSMPAAALMALFASSGIIFGVLYFRRGTLKASQEPLLMAE